MSKNAMSAWQERLLLPINPVGLPDERAREGREIFEQAGCAICHSGQVLTNNRIIALDEIGTNPARVV